MNILMLILLTLCCLSVVLFPSVPAILTGALVAAFAVSQMKGNTHEEV